MRRYAGNHYGFAGLAVQAAFDETGMTMIRILAVVGGALLLSGCASMNLDFLKTGPVMDTVRFESEPPGAEARTSTGQNCRTPCALAIEASNPVSVTFNLNGYRPETEQLEVISGPEGQRLRPNPVTVELTAAPPAPRRATPAPRKKPAPRAAAPAAPRAAAPAAAAPAPAAASSASPWPSTPR